MSGADIYAAFYVLVLVPLALWGLYRVSLMAHAASCECDDCAAEATS